MKCDAGCMIFTGGEKRHLKTCPFYPESISQMLDVATKAMQETIKGVAMHHKEFTDDGSFVFRILGGALDKMGISPSRKQP